MSILSFSMSTFVTELTLARDGILLASIEHSSSLVSMTIDWSFSRTTDSAVGVLLLLVLLPVIVGCGMRSVTLPACSAGSVAHAAPETQAEMMATIWAAGPADMAAVGAQGHSPAAAVVAPANPSVPFDNSPVGIYRQNW